MDKNYATDGKDLVQISDEDMAQLLDEGQGRREKRINRILFVFYLLVIAGLVVAGIKYGFLTALIAGAAIFVIFFFLDVTVFAALTTKKG